MEPVKRKRITRVGSGAYSIYLPKKWIDSWSPEQQKEREVDLYLISGRLLIAPTHEVLRYAAEVPPDGDRVRALLLSAYVRGFDEAQLRAPAGKRFDNDCVITARDLLRHLDERLVATATADAIGFRLPRDVPAPARSGAEVLAALGGKVREVLGLARDCVETYGTDPERALHAARLLRTVHEEDVARIFHQTLRMVARVELPINTVSDFQLLDLVAAELHTIGERALRIADTVLADYGLTAADLAYPREHVLQKVGRVQPLPGVAREFVQGYRKAFDDALPILDGLLSALARRDVATLAELAGEGRAAQRRLQERIFATVVERWGDEGARAGGSRIFSTYRLADIIGNTLGLLARIAEHAVKILAAETHHA